MTNHHRKVRGGGRITHLNFGGRNHISGTAEARVKELIVINRINATKNFNAG